MNYALIENDIIINVIWLSPYNADEFPNAVPLNDVPAGIGDTYKDGKFYRDGKQIYGMAETAYQLQQAFEILGIDETTLGDGT